MTNKRGWQREGLGQTGEAVIVGQDYLLRTNSRQYLENPEAYLARLNENGVSEEKLDRIRNYKTTILQTLARFPSVNAALASKEGTTIERNVRGRGSASLVAYTSLHIEGLNWAIASRMYLQEALKPVSEMHRLFSW